MGGGRVSSASSSADEETPFQQHSPAESTFVNPSYRQGGLNVNTNNDGFGLFHGVSSANFEYDAQQKRRDNVYREVLHSYDALKASTDRLPQAKAKILRYIPGAWMENVGGMNLNDYDVPKTTSLLLIGPKSSGKSTLVNKISRVFEDNKFTAARAQVSYNSSAEDGTFFVQGYMIPKGSTSFCVYDTRGLSDCSSDNIEMLKKWMTKGVRHGELVLRDKDSSGLRTRLKCKAQKNGFLSGEVRMINFVIYVVNGLSVLKSMEGGDAEDKQYMDTIYTTFNTPYLSFEDDKPAIVVTHGDLLSHADRARVCVYLGELLGIPPTEQIFDIPDNCDAATELTIVNMLQYSLEHAEKNIPRSHRDWLAYKVQVLAITPRTWLLIFIMLAMAIVCARVHNSHIHLHHAPRSKIKIDWHKIRHLWLDLD